MSGATVRFNVGGTVSEVAVSTIKSKPDALLAKMIDGRFPSTKDKLHLAPCTPHPTPYTLRPTPCTLPIVRACALAGIAKPLFSTPTRSHPRKIEGLTSPSIHPP